jgi:MFS family permease
MAGIAADDGVQLGPAAKKLGRRRAAGIYGAIITAAILDTAGGKLPTAALVVTVVVTLLVYWLAEEYAELLGEQAEGGHLPSGASIRGALAATWPMVSASYAPLLALVLARLAGASALAAANVGLAAAIVLLTIHGWLAGRAAQLRGWQLFFATSVAAALGLVMILLKDLVLIHLH